MKDDVPDQNNEDKGEDCNGCDDDTETRSFWLHKCVKEHFNDRKAVAKKILELKELASKNCQTVKDQS